MHKGDKFREMALSAKDSIEDFNCFSEDRAIAWAYDRIRTLEEALYEIADMKTPHCDNHISVSEMQRIARTVLNDV